MSTQLEAGARISFGLYEADLQSGELWKSGRKIKLQTQPFKVLAALIERHGEVVTRDELQTLLWGKDAIGDFDHSLGTAINKIREALSDNADNPRFVETLARRGYRFIAPVTLINPHPSPVTVQSSPRSAFIPATTFGMAAAAEPQLAATSKPSPGKWWIALAFAVALTAAAVGYLAGTRKQVPLVRIQRISHTSRLAPGMQAMESFPASATDGIRIFTNYIFEGRRAMAQVDVHTGTMRPLAVPDEISGPALGDLSPDGASLLLRSHLSPESEQPLWMVPTSGGSALRLSNVVAHDATWMTDGRSVLFAAGNQLSTIRLSDGSTRLFATLPGRAFWLRWSPDGALLRFTVIDPVNHTLRLWEVKRDGSGLRPILTDWPQPSLECCGVWSGDGRIFVFQSNRRDDGGDGRDEGTDLWRMDGKLLTNPTRITNGPLSFEGPTMPRTGHHVYFLGVDAHEFLLQFDPARHIFVPKSDFLGVASRIEYSRDGKWVLWTDLSGRLYRARPDGSEMIQLTPASLQVFLARWSPDGNRIALMAREPGKAWRIYLVAPDGGTPQRLLAESRNEADPSWSQDGAKIVFGRVSDIMGKEDGPRDIELLDLRTHALTTLPGSQGLFSPRWSPDGRFIAALSLDQRRLVVFDVAAQSWKTLADVTAADPVWTSDSRFIVFHASQADKQPLYRAAIAGGGLEKIADLSDFGSNETADYFFCGLTPADLPIVRARTGTADLYSMDLDQ